MSEVPANPFAAPDGRRPDQASALTPSPDPGGSPYGQPAAPMPVWGTPVYPSGAPPYGPAPTYAGPYPYPPPSAYPYEAREASNGLAIAAMIIGIASVALCFFFIPAIVGLVLGIVALGQTKKGSGGRGMAVAGVATSAVSLVLAIVFVIIGMMSDGTTDEYGTYTTQGPTEQVTSDDLAAAWYL